MEDFIYYMPLSNVSLSANPVFDSTELDEFRTFT